MRLTAYNIILVMSSIILATVVVSLYKKEYVYGRNLELHTIPFHIPRQTKQQEEIRNGVPLVIYESWKTHEVPTGMRDNIMTLLKANPEFDYYLYSDEDCAAFIEDNYEAEVLAAFKSLKPGAYKSDLWRYCILYKLGGVYLDIKSYSTVPLVDILDEVGTVYVRDMDAYGYQMIAGDFEFGHCLYNGFMASPPKNEIFKACIDDIVKSCRGRLYKRNAIDVTGPCLLGSVVQRQISKEFIDALPFKSYVRYGNIGNMEQVVLYKDKVVLRNYATYREEQSLLHKKTDSLHYSALYARSDVYN